MNPKSFDPGPLAEVEHRRTGQLSTLVFVRQLAHPPEKVWKALTDPDQLRRWAPYVPGRDLASPGPATLEMIDGSGGEVLPGEVKRAEAPRLLEYTWGDSLLVWELEPHEGGTRLTLRHTVESVEWLPKAAAGWHLCLRVAEHLLGGDPIEPIVGEKAMDHGWKQLAEGYARALGLRD